MVSVKQLWVDCDKRHSFLIFRGNQGLSKQGTEEPQRGGICQVLLGMAETNEEMHELRGEYSEEDNL